MRITSAAWWVILSSIFVSAATYASDLDMPSTPEKKPGREQEISRLRPGIQGGLNGSFYSTSPDVNASSRVGYILGVELEYRLSPVWFIQPEVRVVQKGFSYNLASGLSIINFDVRVEYIELPFLVKAKFLPSSIIQPFVFAGPNIGFKIGSNVDVSSGGNYVSGPSLVALFNTVDFSIDSGFGGEYHFARRMAGFLEFRASIGLNNVSQLENTNWKSRDYQFIFGGLFDL